MTVVEHVDGQRLLDGALEQFAVPGAQLGLLQRHERSVFCSGSADPGDGRPVVPGTAFHAGSITKALAGLVVLAAARSLLTQTSGRPDLLLRRTTGRSFEESATGAFGPATTFGMPAGAAAGHVCLPGQDAAPVPPTYAPAASAAGSRWWTTADQLLDFAAMNRNGGQGVFSADDVAAVRGPAAELPGSTVFDFWGMGWAVWDRGAHRTFGRAGLTDGHRAYLRCFPDQDAAVVLLANGAGPLFGPPGGSALFDALLPDVRGAP